MCNTVRMLNCLRSAFRTMIDVQQDRTESGSNSESCKTYAIKPSRKRDG